MQWQLTESVRNVTCAADLDGSLTAPPVDRTLTSADRLAAVRTVLQEMEMSRADSGGSRMMTVTMFDAKEQYKVLCRCCGVVSRCGTQYADPKVACWLLDPSSNEKNLHCLVTNYCPQDATLLQGLVFFPSYLAVQCQTVSVRFKMVKNRVWIQCLK